MSSNISNTFTREQLFDCLKFDKVKVSEDMINKAKNNDGEALRIIGYEYKMQIKDYSKAMAWYRLAVHQNEPRAYNSIAMLYAEGHGVSKSYHTAIMYYLKVAEKNISSAMDNIALCFSNGYGIPLDKYKALEWYSKSGNKRNNVEKLNKEGIHLKEEDKSKTLYQLINEVEDILQAERQKTDKEYQELKKLQSSYQRLRTESQQREQHILLLEQENQRSIDQMELSMQLVNNLELQLMNKTETIKSLEQVNKVSKEVIEVLEMLVLSKDSEIGLLKKIQRYRNQDRKSREEIRVLKRKLEEKRHGFGSSQSSRQKRVKVSTFCDSLSRWLFPYYNSSN